MSAITVSTFNLLPARRRHALARRRRIRAWTPILVVYGVAVAGVWGWFSFGASFSSGRPGESAADQLAAVNKDIDARRAQHKSVLDDIKASQRKLDGAKAVGHHPDWSVLLAKIAEVGAKPSQLVVLDSVELRARAAPANQDPKRPGAPAAPADTPPGAYGYTLVLDGITEKQVNVVNYAEDLQNLVLFENVAIDWTKPRDNVAPDAQVPFHLVSFQITCTLTDPAAAKHLQASPAPARKERR